MLNTVVKNSIQRCEQLDELIRTAKHNARSIACADGATVILREGDKCFYADEDAISPLWKGQRFDIGACISGWAMIHGKQACISNIYIDDRIPVEAYERTFVKSLVMTPMSEMNSIGALGVYWSREYELDQTTRDDLADLARVVGQNIKKIISNSK